MIAYAIIAACGIGVLVLGIAAIRAQVHMPGGLSLRWKHATPVRLPRRRG